MPVSSDFQTATELRGLGLPADRGSEGVFASRDQFDTAWSALLLALFTPQGGRVMSRSFGSNLYGLLFEPVVEEFEIAEVLIRDAATRLVPQVVIRRVTVVTAGEAIRVGIVFSLTSDRTQETSRTVLLKKTAVTSVSQIP